jgi:8-amino-7-oxononanoate synthase
MCTACGCAAPIADYLYCVRQAGGLLIVDDTQAVGLLGLQPEATMPYGHGGGGSLRYCGIGGSNVVVVSSLAKGFGVPLAILSGSKDVVRQFEASSQTRVHCSPPSAASIHSAERALKLNTKYGDVLRGQLVQLVKQFRERVAEVGLGTVGGLFPVQTLKLPISLDAQRLYQQLADLGVRTVLRSGHNGIAQISFIITVRHHIEDIDRAARTLESAVRAQLQQPETTNAVLRMSTETFFKRYKI